MFLNSACFVERIIRRKGYISAISWRVCPLRFCSTPRGYKASCSFAMWHRWSRSSFWVSDKKEANKNQKSRKINIQKTKTQFVNTQKMNERKNFQIEHFFCGVETTKFGVCLFPKNFPKKTFKFLFCSFLKSFLTNIFEFFGFIFYLFLVKIRDFTK